jgi:hypothetical protein
MEEDPPQKKAKTSSTDAPQESINEAFKITKEAWTKALDTPWKHHGFGGPNRRRQGLTYTEPSLVTCRVCDNIQVHWHRLSQHIAGTKHAANLEKWKHDGHSLKDSDEDNDQVESQDLSTKTKVKNINEKFAIDEAIWAHAMESSWKHRGVSGKNKFGQGLKFTPPNNIVCTVCDNTQIHFHRMGVHIAGSRHMENLRAYKLKHGEPNTDASSKVSTKDNAKTLEDRCREEVLRLHRLFVVWSNASDADKDGVFQMLSDAFATDFHIVSPDGNLSSATEFLGVLQQSYGKHKESGMNIEIKNPKLLSEKSKDHAIFKYEEWQKMGDVETGRIATVMFRSSSSGVNGLQWAHVHETWIPKEEQVVV